MKHYIFVEARAIEQKATEYVRSLGLSPVLLTGFQKVNPKAFSLINLSQFDHVYHVDTNDAEKMHQLVRDKHLNVTGVSGCYDETILPTAKLAKKLGLPHQNIGGLENAFYKDTVRSILADHHIRQPAYCVIELDKAPVTAPLAFPFIIKPARDSGAAGVFLCRSPEDYHQALKAYHTHTRTFAGLQRTRILLEEFIEGDFYGAELLWHEDHWKVIGINKIFVDPSKSLCMTGIAHPADIHLNHLATIEKTIVHWVNLIGLEGGVINIEFKLVDNVPILIEINLRLAGALINEQVKHTTGISLVEQVINQACGLKTELRLTSTRCYTADAFVFFNKPGEILNEIDRSSIDSTHLISFTHVPLPFEALPSRELYFSMIVGHILASGVSCEDAMRNAENMVAQLQLKSTKMYDNEAICRS